MRAESPDNLHNTVQATISERSALTRVKIDISGYHNVLSIPWHAIDEAIQESPPHLDIFEVECFAPGKRSLLMHRAWLELSVP